MDNKDSEYSRLFLEKNEEWVHLSRCGLNLLQIAKIEIQTAIARVPDLLFLYIVRLPAMILMWISFSLLPAWMAYELTNMIFPALLTFFLLQVSLVILIDRVVRRKQRESSLPFTRAYATRISALIFSDPEETESRNNGEQVKRNEI